MLSSFLLSSLVVAVSSADVYSELTSKLAAVPAAEQKAAKALSKRVVSLEKAQKEFTKDLKVGEKGDRGAEYRTASSAFFEFVTKANVSNKDLVTDFRKAFKPFQKTEADLRTMKRSADALVAEAGDISKAAKKLSIDKEADAVTADISGKTDVVVKPFLKPTIDAVKTFATALEKQKPSKDVVSMLSGLVATLNAAMKRDDKNKALKELLEHVLHKQEEMQAVVFPPSYTGLIVILVVVGALAAAGTGFYLYKKRN